MERLESPCKKNGIDCPKRKVTLDFNCHSNCKEFKEYEKENERKRKRERKLKDTMHDYVCIRTEKRIQCMKKKNELKRK